MAAVLLLAAWCFAAGYAAGHLSDRPQEAPPPEGVELWRTLPPEQLANVAEGILERISELQDDLELVREMQSALVG